MAGLKGSGVLSPLPQAAWPCCSWGLLDSLSLCPGVIFSSWGPPHPALSSVERGSWGLGEACGMEAAAQSLCFLTPPGHHGRAAGSADHGGEAAVARAGTRGGQGYQRPLAPRPEPQTPKQSPRFFPSRTHDLILTHTPLCSPRLPVHLSLNTTTVQAFSCH